MKFVKRVVVIGALVAPALGAGHEGGLDARGTIKTIGADEVVLSTAQGKDQAYALGPDTKFRRGAAPARREDVRAGERAVVHARREGDKLHATEIRLAPAGAASKKGGKP
jgi:hypothetical protein